MAQFNEVLHAPHRLKACVILSQATQVDFATVRDMLEVSDSTMSKQVKILVDEGYVAAEKQTPKRGGRPRTWLSLTPAGKKALTGHLAVLEAMIADSRQAQSL